MIKKHLFFLLLFFSFLSIPWVFGEAISNGSALVWRADALGDYILPAIPAESTYVPDSIIAAKGIIKSITATWRSEGDVALEVSADGGVHYFRVVNGVPLTRDFAEGSSLRWRARVGADSRLFEVRVAYTDSSGASLGFGNPLLSGFKFKKGLRISGSQAGDLFNYQIKIRVGESVGAKNTDLDCEGHIAADFNDIRFTLPDGTTTLDCYLERVIGYKPDRVAEFFIKIPHIPVSGITIYAYYGNPIARGTSDPQATFDFFDRFGGVAVDADKWITHVSPGGKAVVSGDMLSLDAASLITKSFEFRGGVVEYSATAEKGFETRLVISGPNPESSRTVYSSAYQGAEHCIAVGNIVRANSAQPIAAGTRYDYRLISIPDGSPHGEAVGKEPGAENIIFERYSPGFVERQVEVSYKDSRGMKKGFIGLKAGGAGFGEPTLTRFHWIRARKYAQPEPAVDKNIGFGEEPANTPIFKNIVLGPNGSLVLAEGYKEGLYVPLAVSSSYDARIMVAAWEGAGVSVDISADSGKTYKRDCVNNAYYYASRKDFVKGRDIKYRLRLKRADGVYPGLESLTLTHLSGTIVVLEPNAQEVLKLGSSKEIRWTAWDYEPTYPMKLEYSVDSGSTFKTIINRTKNSGSYLWEIASDPGLATQKGRVRVSDGFDDSVFDESDRDFSIVDFAGIEH